MLVDNNLDSMLSFRFDVNISNFTTSITLTIPFIFLEITFVSLVVRRHKYCVFTDIYFCKFEIEVTRHKRQ